MNRLIEPIIQYLKGVLVHRNSIRLIRSQNPFQL